MAKEYTSLRVSQAAKDAAQEAKQEGETWDDYIQRCSNNPPEIREFVEASDGVNFDDVKSACQAAIREELPTERMG